MDQTEICRLIQTAYQEKRTSLDLSFKGITVLPPEIGQLTQLTELNLSNNQLIVLPLEITRLKQLTLLSLGGNQLIILPPEIGQLTQLRELPLFNNQLAALPPEIGQLTQLTELYLSDNKLTILPQEIGQLTRLTELDLFNNQLIALPPEIGQLTQLTELPLFNNQLTVLPPEIGQLTQLTELYLFNNQLTALPAEIGQLTQLTELNLSNNQLTVLPPEIGQLTQLTKLNLNDNQLTILPPEIAPFAARCFINLLPNPLTNIPPEVVEQGKTAIFAYLQELFEGHSRLWVSKLMLVGEGGVGKTSLLCALRGEEFSDSSTTRGIDIRSLELPHPGDGKITLKFNAWDFGGQEIYHATHQFFLTNRSLFVLVWNARHGYEQGKLYDWLDRIQAGAPDSPVMVVAAWVDERDADLPTADLQKKYPRIIGFYKVSNKTQQGIAELRQAIAQAAVQSLPMMGEKWPDSWLKAAEAVRACPEKYITPEAFWALTREQGVSETGAKVLARWLHELGDILFFRDDDELNDLVIL